MVKNHRSLLILRVTVSGLRMKQSLQFPQSLAVELSVMQHLQYRRNSLSKFAIARLLPLLRRILWHIIFPVLLVDAPCHLPCPQWLPTPQIRLTMRTLQMILLYRIVLHCIVSTFFCALKSIHYFSKFFCIRFLTYKWILSSYVFTAIFWTIKAKQSGIKTSTMILQPEESCQKFPNCYWGTVLKSRNDGRVTPI